MVFPSFAAYVAAFDKVYDTDEINWREVIYDQAIAKMEADDADDMQTYSKGVNQFADLTLEEFHTLQHNRAAAASPASPRTRHTARDGSSRSSYTTAISQEGVVEVDQSAFQRYSGGIVTSLLAMDNGVLSANGRQNCTQGHHRLKIRPSRAKLQIKPTQAPRIIEARSFG